jgi:hypothetical protein
LALLRLRTESRARPAIGRFSERVTEDNDHTMEVRRITGADDAGQTWNLGCEVREKMIDFLQSEFPEALSHQRAYVALTAGLCFTTMAAGAV